MEGAQTTRVRVSGSLGGAKIVLGLANGRAGETSASSTTLSIIEVYHSYATMPDDRHSRSIDRSIRRVGAEGGGEMNEFEPDTWRSQWLWFGAALLAMSTIAAILTKFPV